MFSVDKLLQEMHFGEVWCLWKQNRKFIEI